MASPLDVPSGSGKPPSDLLSSDRIELRELFSLSSANCKIGGGSGCDSTTRSFTLIYRERRFVGARFLSKISSENLVGKPDQMRVQLGLMTGFAKVF